jgi:hypothetical protein
LLEQQEVEIIQAFPVEVCANCGAAFEADNLDSVEFIEGDIWNQTFTTDSEETA